MGLLYIGPWLALLAGLALQGSPLAAAGEPEPLWAYGFLTPPAPGDTAPPQPPPSRALRKGEDPAEQQKLRQVEGSEARFSYVDIRDGGHVVDWFPSEHPPATPIITLGPAKLGAAAKGCGFCHLTSGRGRPENAPVSGQSTAYFIRQLQDFRAGNRTSADPRKPNTPAMIGFAKAMTDSEMAEAAAYFAGIPWKPWIRVVETDRVPTTHIEGNLFLVSKPGATEPIAGRIIEVAEDEHQANDLRNPHSGFLAYVPRGSLAAGEDLVKTGGARTVNGTLVAGRTVACAACHGPDLSGLGDAPAIAGRSPSYLARQLYDLQQGTRHGQLSAVMKPTVENLRGTDIVAIVAYVASIKPKEGGG